MTTLKKTGHHNRKARRKAGSEFAKLAANKDWGKWQEIHFEKEAAIKSIMPPPGLTNFYKNNIFTVQVIPKNGIIRAMIRRNDESTNVSWKDKQRIKNDLFGEESLAIEVFPPQKRLVDEANIYWLWILPTDNYPFCV